MEWNGSEGMEWNGMEQMEWNGMEMTEPKARNGWNRG